MPFGTKVGLVIVSEVVGVDWPEGGPNTVALLMVGCESRVSGVMCVKLLGQACVGVRGFICNKVSYPFGSRWRGRATSLWSWFPLLQMGELSVTLLLLRPLKAFPYPFERRYGRRRCKYPTLESDLDIS